MAPRRPRSQEHRSSAPPSPTKSSPRKSTDRRRSGDPRRIARDGDTRDGGDGGGSGGGTSAESPTKRASRDIDGDSPTKDNERRQRHRRQSSSSPRKSGGERRKSGSPTKQGTPSKARPRGVAVEESDSHSSSNTLSADSLAKLDARNTYNIERARKQQQQEDKGKVVTGRVVKERARHKHRRRESQNVAATTGAAGGAILTEKNLQARGGSPRKNRVRAVAASVLEAGSQIGRHRGGGGSHMDKPANTSRRKKFLCLGALVVAVLLLILVPVGVLVVGKQNNGGGGGGSSSSGPDNGNLGDINPDSIPQWAKGGNLDPFSWYDTQDFNLTFTNATVGGLYVMGLNSTWDDTVQANSNVPPLNKPFGYGTLPIRGVNLGGWLSIEPFITPSLFNSYGSKQNVVDEYTLCQTLGPTTAKQTIEKHYSSFINGQTFSDVRDAGFDHVRIPYSYWAVTTYPGDPYVEGVAWRYLLRGIEYARQNGLRVNLDFHGLPGSQNGWNHSGRQGLIGWLNGTDGDLNGQRSLDLHKQLSTFFAQPRYSNVVSIYGLVNEPRMISLPTNVVMNWTSNAIDIVRGNGMQQWIAVGDGFLGLPKWQGQLSGEKNVVLDAHQYVIFNTDQIAMDHQDKLNYACSGWQGQMKQSTNTATGFGPTLCGEWSQADTDCTTYINNVNVGSRWTGTMNLGDPSLNVLSPTCPLKNNDCSCDAANADPSTYSSQYKQWLRWNAEAQMTSFEIGLGWFYWTWLTESAAQWSWKLGMEAGILPDKVWNRDYNCSAPSPNFASMGLPETY